MSYNIPRSVKRCSWNCWSIFNFITNKTITFTVHFWIWNSHFVVKLNCFLCFVWWNRVSIITCKIAFATKSVNYHFILNFFKVCSKKCRLGNFCFLFFKVLIIVINIFAINKTFKHIINSVINIINYFIKPINQTWKIINKFCAIKFSINFNFKLILRIDLCI